MSSSFAEISVVRSQIEQIKRVAGPEYDYNPEQIDQVASALAFAQLKHLPRLKRWLAEFKSSRSKGSNKKTEQLVSLLCESLAVTQRRIENPIQLSYNAELPISDSLAEIRQCLHKHQVVIVAGETGSGKTTQLPKLCLELGLGVLGQIGHTQPRRLAARTVASRIADELAVSLGSTVGYQFRFDDQSKPDTRCKVMTDGILLSEIRRDKLLLNYDTLIIDEAHERSLNIDFLLGYIKTLLPRRPDLKLIVTSATIDVERFSSYFNGAPVVSVEGRSYPVKVVYRQEHEDTEQVLSLGEEVQSVLDNIAEEEDEQQRTGARDVLVFLPGEREIRELSKHLRHTAERLGNYEVLPLYARLTRAEQQRVFDERRSGKARRIILATNVAETSVTVPGIGYVIDTGQARVNRFSPQSKLQRLLIEPVSQASARQRSGRCGRIAPGTCYRLYTENDFSLRPEFTEPEILRTKLASVILQMKSLGLGNIDAFPFIEQPDNRQINRGIRNLVELGALDSENSLTRLGRQIAMLPLDPAHGRMLLEARTRGCLEEMLVVVSALAVQDPREMPADAREAADQRHRRFWHPQSDFLMWLNLWFYFQRQSQSMSQTALRKLCKREWLSYTRMREWKDLHWQLRQSLNRLFGERKVVELQLPLSLEDKLDGMDEKQRQQAMQAVGSWNRRYSLSNYEAIHKSILAGYALQVGNRMTVDSSAPGDKNRRAAAEQRKPRQGFEFRGCSGSRFFIFPGSSQFKKPPQWVLAGEIAQTQKVYARCVAAVEPEWIEQSTEPLLKYQYSEPKWDKKRGQVVARRSSSLFGLPVVRNRPVLYDKLDPVASRDCFIREALVAKNLTPDKKLEAIAKFWTHNLQLLGDLESLAERLRDATLLPDDEALYNHYHQRLPASVVSRRSLYQTLRTAPELSDNLCLSRDQLVDSSRSNSAEQQFPQQIEMGGHSVSLVYRFSPGTSEDGVTALVPLNILHSLPAYSFDWLVPGLLTEKVLEMLRLLPKSQRKQLVPLPAAADKLLSKLDVEVCRQANQPLANALAEEIKIYYEIAIDVRAWQQSCAEKLDPIYMMHVNVKSDDESDLVQGDNVHDLQQQLHKKIEKVIQQVDGAADQKKRYTSWDFGELALRTAVAVDEAGVRGYSAITDQGESVSIGLVVTEGEANIVSRQGVLRLAMMSLKDKTRYLKKQFKQVTVPVLPYVSIGQHAELVEDLIKAAIAHCCFSDFENGLPLNESEFKDCLSRGAAEVIPVANAIESLVHEILLNYQHCCELVQSKRAHFPQLCEDAELQLRDLLYPGFLCGVGYYQVQQFSRYLLAIQTRIERIGGNEKIDNEYREKLSSLRERWQSLLYKYPYAIHFDRDLKQYRWMLEELRVSLFAQQLKTAQPVSWQRLDKAWEKVDMTQYPLA